MLIQQIFPSVIFFCAAAAYSAHGVLALTMATRQWRSSAPKTRVCRMLFELHTSILPTASLLYNEYVECSKNICFLLVFQYWLTVRCYVALRVCYSIVATVRSSACSSSPVGDPTGLHGAMLLHRHARSVFAVIHLIDR